MVATNYVCCVHSRERLGTFYLALHIHPSVSEDGEPLNNHRPDCFMASFKGWTKLPPFLMVYRQPLRCSRCFYMIFQMSCMTFISTYTFLLHVVVRCLLFTSNVHRMAVLEMMLWNFSHHMTNPFAGCFFFFTFTRIFSCLYW